MSSIVFIHALSKEATQKLLNKELFIESTQDYIFQIQKSQQMM